MACAPQAWASASLFWLIESCLGLSFRQPSPQICFTASLLPGFIDELRIKNLTAGQASVDLLFQRHPHDVGIQVLRREGEVDILIAK